MRFIASFPLLKCGSCNLSPDSKLKEEEMVKFDEFWTNSWSLTLVEKVLLNIEALERVELTPGKEVDSSKINAVCSTDFARFEHKIGEVALELW